MSARVSRWRSAGILLRLLGAAGFRLAHGLALRRRGRRRSCPSHRRAARPRRPPNDRNFSTTTVSPTLRPEDLHQADVGLEPHLHRTNLVLALLHHVETNCSLATAPSGTTVAPFLVPVASVTSAKKPGFSVPGFLTQAITWRLVASATAHVVDAGPKSRSPVAATGSPRPAPLEPGATRPRDSEAQAQPETSTRASRLPARTNWPVSTVLVLMTPAEKA